ncbi:MAG: NFACT RNA binding domain-containing protein [Planctomycetota bacterium]
MKPPAPKGLRPEEVALLIRELSPVISGARIDKVFDRGRHGFLLRLRGQGERRHLLVTTRPGFTRFHLLDPPGQLPREPSSDAMRLRELLAGARVISIDQPGGDRLVRFVLKRGARTEERSLMLVLELFGGRGRLLVAEGGDRRVCFVAGRGGLPLGAPYRFPEPPGGAREGLPPFDPVQLVPVEERDEPLAFHAALGRSMEASERRADREERRLLLERRLGKETRRRRALLEALQKDEKRALQWSIHQRRGDLLKGELGRVRRGETQVQVTDWFDPSTPEVEIPLDPRLTPAENLEAMFRRARKRRRSLPILKRRMENCRQQIEALEAAQAGLSSLSDPESSGEDLPGAPGDFDPEGDARAAFSRAEDLLRGLERGRPGRGGRGATGRAAPPSGPRRFRSREGLEILCGRSARENDRLSRTIARGNDLFFHRAFRPGPHVILRVPRGKSAAPESIEDAAFLAAYLAGWRGPGAAVVHWTEAKHVRKPKGYPPGKVALEREREHRVSYRPELLERLRWRTSGDEPSL